jgi:AraC-like DNA-binding protein
LFVEDAHKGDVAHVEILNRPLPPETLQHMSGIVFAARARLGTVDHPFIQTLPRRTALSIADDPHLKMMVSLAVREVGLDRCGVRTVMNRLAEILFIQVLRNFMDSGLAKAGVLNGLSDDRISRALVAIHGEPSYAWNAENLAEIAFMSRSRFIDVFRTKVGQTPIAYLRQWRLTLAWQDIQGGAQVKSVARGYAYNSGEALSRAFKKQFGFSPADMPDRSKGPSKPNDDFPHSEGAL